MRCDALSGFGADPSYERFEQTLQRERFAKIFVDTRQARPFALRGPIIRGDNNNGQGGVLRIAADVPHQRGVFAVHEVQITRDEVNARLVRGQRRSRFGDAKRPVGVVSSAAQSLAQGRPQGRIIFDDQDPAPRSRLSATVLCGSVLDATFGALIAFVVAVSRARFARKRFRHRRHRRHASIHTVDDRAHDGALDRRRRVPPFTYSRV